MLPKTGRFGSDASPRQVGRLSRHGDSKEPMENGEAAPEAEPKKDEPSYEDSWYQVIKRRSQEPEGDADADAGTDDADEDA